MDQDINVIVDVALNKWALGIQVAILSILTTVFLALWLNSLHRVLFAWLLAWTANLCALLAVFGVILGTGVFSETALRMLYVLYAWFKLWFAILLIFGLSRHFYKNSLLNPSVMRFLLAFTISGGLLLLLMQVDMLIIQILVYILVGGFLLMGGVYFLFKTDRSQSKIFQLVLCCESFILLHHAWVLIPAVWGGPIPRYMTRISFFDSIAELIVGATCLFVIANRVITVLKQRNSQMEEAQQALRELVDVDPLTGLWNRRHIETFMQAHGETGYLIYIDVDRFKQINDGWGHAMGDVCLQRIADGLRKHFSTDCGIFRLGGDEFLVISGADEMTIHQDINALKKELMVRNEALPSVSISVGIQEMSETVSFEKALQQADTAMYSNKRLGVSG
ncbi:GGDEF domain-containing protein [Marinicella sp. W31]|uniref:GGDEF domain-containing protein n=1 Tax=Marinicella sp. W31 TaxID=3023713 RepID=UPI003756FFD8